MLILQLDAQLESQPHSTVWDPSNQSFWMEDNISLGYTAAHSGF